MQVIISDTSCLIDLQKVSLLDVCLQLPYKIVIPDVLLSEEIIKFTPEEKSLLQKRANIWSLSGEEVLRVIEVRCLCKKLTINDCFVFVIAESIFNSILLAGDEELRNLAKANNLKFRGVLWVVEQLYQAQLVSAKVLHQALLEWKHDQTVRLPPAELNKLIESFKNL